MSKKRLKSNTINVIIVIIKAVRNVHHKYLIMEVVS